MKNYMKQILTTLLTLIIFISCSKNKENTENAIYVNLGGEPQTIDPTIAIGNDSFAYASHVFEGLSSKDINGKIMEGSAYKWDISEDGLTYTFYIRTNAKWSDGKPLTANDFVYSWRRAVDPKVANKFSYLFEHIKNSMDIVAGKKSVNDLGVKAIDDYTFQVTLDSPTLYFLELITIPMFFPLREDIIETNKEGWSLSPETYIGNGPFKMSERKIDEHIILEKNTNYWASSNVLPEKIVFVLMNNPTSSVAGIKAGTLQFSDKIPTQDIDALKSEGLIKISPFLGTYYYAMNLTNDILKDVRIRKALTLAIDRNYIVEKITKGGETPAGAFVPYGMKDIEGDFRKKDYYSLKPEDYKKNIEEAKKLMAEAGYENGKGFPVIEFKVDAQNNHIQIFEAIQEMWKQNLNIDTTMSQEEWAVYLQTVYTDFNYVISRSGWTAEYNDPMTFLGIFLSYSSQNNTLYNSKNYDDLLKKAMSTVDQKARMESMHKAEDVLMEDMALIPIYYYTKVNLIDKNLKDVMFDPAGVYIFKYAYIEK